MMDDLKDLLLSIGPGVGCAVHWAIYRYYRNLDKTHAFERETTIVGKPVTGFDKLVKRDLKKESRIEGENVKDHRQRVKRIPEHEPGSG